MVSLVIAKAPHRSIDVMSNMGRLQLRIFGNKHCFFPVAGQLFLKAPALWWMQASLSTLASLVCLAG